MWATTQINQCPPTLTRPVTIPKTNAHTQASTAAHLAALQGTEHAQGEPEYKPGTLHLNVDQHDFHEVCWVVLCLCLCGGMVSRRWQALIGLELLGPCVRLTNSRTTTTTTHLQVITGHTVYVPPDLAAQQEDFYARKADKQRDAAAAPPAAGPAATGAVAPAVAAADATAAVAAAPAVAVAAPPAVVDAGG